MIYLIKGQNVQISDFALDGHAKALLRLDLQILPLELYPGEAVGR